jgi:drug/metabolite transporter (DMT)-like permease
VWGVSFFDEPVILKRIPPSLLGVFAAVASSTLGGSAIVATRFIVPDAGVLPTIFLRFAGAALIMLAITLPRMRLDVRGRDLPIMCGLALMQFVLFPWCFTQSLTYVPAARGALVLSTQPLITLVFAAMAGRERITLIKVVGGLLALVAVVFALGDRVAASGDDAWRGDLYMFGAALSGSIYNVAASYALRRYRALVAASVMLPTGAIAIAVMLVWQGDYSGFARIDADGWMAVVWLMTLGGAGTFFLWIWALEHTAPSRVALAVTFNPLTAAILGAFVLMEPVTWRLAVGLAGIVGSLLLVNGPALRASLRRGDGAG